MWGGMSGGFNKPAPVFRRPDANPSRRTSTMPEGVIMPKKRDQVVRENEHRLSMIFQEIDEFDCSWAQEQTPPGTEARRIVRFASSDQCRRGTY